MRKMKDYRKEIKLYRLGVPIATIARGLGITRSSLWQSFKRRGVLRGQEEGEKDE